METVMWKGMERLVNRDGRAGGGEWRSCVSK